LVTVAAFLLIPTGLYLLLRNAALEGIIATKHHLFIDNMMADAPVSTRLATAFFVLLNICGCLSFLILCRAIIPMLKCSLPDGATPWSFYRFFCMPV